MSNTAGPPGSDPYVYLMGRPPMTEWLGFMQYQTEGGAQEDPRRLADEWRRANDRITELEAAEAGLADSVPIAPLPATMAALASELTEDAAFQRNFTVVPISIGLVELDRLVVFQKQINLAYVDHLKGHGDLIQDDARIFRLCMPTGAAVPPVAAHRVAPNAIDFVSPSNDLRLLSADLLPVDALVGRVGRPTGGVALVVGFGGNYLSAVQAEGRLVLNNGSHRAYLLRQLGITHAPCVVQHVSRPEELEVVLPEVNAQPERYLHDPRPPLLKDYFDDRLRRIVHLGRTARHVRVSFGVNHSIFRSASKNHLTLKRSRGKRPEQTGRLPVTNEWWTRHERLVPQLTYEASRFGSAQTAVETVWVLTGRRVISDTRSVMTVSLMTSMSSPTTSTSVPRRTRAAAGRWIGW